MKQAYLAASLVLAAACGGSSSSGGPGDGGGAFVMASVLVGSCHANLGQTDEDCTAWRDNTIDGVDIQAFTEAACAAPDAYSTGQCAGGAPYGCCKWTFPGNADVQGATTAMYECAIGSDNAPTETWNYPEACSLGGGVWSAGPPSL